MKTFSELREAVQLPEASGTYKGTKWKTSKAGSFYSLYVDGEKIDVYKSEKEAEKAAKEFIDFK